MFIFVVLSCLFLATLGSADRLALLCVVFSCVFVPLVYGVLGHLWYLIVSIPDIFLPLYFTNIGVVAIFVK